jgi:acyl-CoA dehydrogenase
VYSFEPSAEQKMLIDVVSRFAQNDLRPVSRDADEGADFSATTVNKGWELGILQASIPEEYGGFGDRSAVTSVLAVEELAWGDLAGSLAILAPNLFAIPILLVGSESQKEKYLPEIIEGEWLPFTAAMIEPYFDFDPNDLRTEAVDAGNVYILNGHKINVPFADKAKAMIVYAKLDGKPQGFIVPGETNGLEIGLRHKLLGINALPNYPVRLKDVRVPKENRLGGEEGCDISLVLDASRIALAAAALGVSRAAFEYSRDYAKEREAFGVKIAQKQAIAFMLAEMATEIEAIRLLVWEAAWMQDNHKPETSKSAYLALTGAIDLAMQVTDRAVQILGGHGYIREYPVEMWMRNGRGIANLAGIALI